MTGKVVSSDRSDLERHGSPLPGLEPPFVAAFPCQECGACCGHSASWPRFTLETDEELARIPDRLVAADLSGMRCEHDRCQALIGEIGTWTACTIYAVRPIVCRDCVPGDDACRIARSRVGLPELTAG